MGKYDQLVFYIFVNMQHFMFGSSRNSVGSNENYQSIQILFECLLRLIVYIRMLIVYGEA